MSDSFKAPTTEGKHPLKDDNSASDELNDIIIGGLTFATADDLKESIKESQRKTEIWTLTDRLQSIDKMTPLPCLKKNNWFQWFESVENLIFLTQTSAAFLPQLPRNKAIRMWSTWWVAKLRETAPH